MSDNLYESMISDDSISQDSGPPPTQPYEESNYLTPDELKMKSSLRSQLFRRKGPMENLSSAIMNAMSGISDMSANPALDTFSNVAQILKGAKSARDADQAQNIQKFQMLQQIDQTGHQRQLQEAQMQDMEAQAENRRAMSKYNRIKMLLDPDYLAHRSGLRAMQGKSGPEAEDAYMEGVGNFYKNKGSKPDSYKTAEEAAVAMELNGNHEMARKMIDIRDSMQKDQPFNLDREMFNDGLRRGMKPWEIGSRIKIMSRAARDSGMTPAQIAGLYKDNNAKKDRVHSSYNAYLERILPEIDQNIATWEGMLKGKGGEESPSTRAMLESAKNRRQGIINQADADKKQRLQEIDDGFLTTLQIASGDVSGPDAARRTAGGLAVPPSKVTIPPPAQVSPPATNKAAPTRAELEAMVREGKAEYVYGDPNNPKRKTGIRVK